MKITPVILDGPAEGKELEVESDSPTFIWRNPDYHSLQFGDEWTYRIKQFGFHLNGEVIVYDVATIREGDPDIRDLVRHVFTDYAKKAIRVQPK